MRKALATITVILALAFAYLLLWPVPVDPVSWQAPASRGYVDPFTRNDSLKSVSGIDLGEYEAPEDATLGRDGGIFVSTKGGAIIRIQNRGVSEHVNVGGTPLGIETDSDGSLVVANAVSGLQRITSDGKIVTLVNAIDAEPLVNANSLGIGPDGVLYFSQSGTKFTAEEFGGTLEPSLLDILEHGGQGSVFAFDPASGQLDQLMTGLNYANGVAVSAGGDFLLVAETAHYRILKYWLTGESQGSTEVLIDNLPGFPDNIKNGINGRFWIGFVAPRNELLDTLSDKPFLRKVVQRLPAAVRPKPEPFSHVIAINADGEVLMNLHESTGRFPMLTGVLETRDSLYLTTLNGNHLPWIKKRDL